MADHETALAIRPPVDDQLAPLPVFGGAAMDQAFAAYRELQQQLDRSMPDQIMTIEDRKFRKKGYWRAVSVAFDLEVTLVEERIEFDGTFDDGRENFGYLVTYRATARNRRSVTGDGACFAIEKAGKFRCPHPEDPAKPSGRTLHYPGERCPDFDPNYVWRFLPGQASRHNVRSHAHTRAFNRAISNLVGFGEVSAEEIDRDDEQGGGSYAPRSSSTPRNVTPPRQGSGPAKISEPQRKRMWAIATNAGWHEDELRSFLKSRGFEHSDDVTRDKYDAICKTLEEGVDGTRGDA